MESATGNSGPQQKFSGFAKEIIGCTMRLKRLLLGADAVVDVQLSLSINLSDDIPEEIRATVLTNQEERFVWLVMKSVGFLNADLSEQASIGAIQEADSFIEDLGAGVSRRSEHRASNSASTQLPSEIVGLVLDPTDNLRNGKEDEGDLKPTEAREAGLQVPDWSTLHSWYTTLQCAQYLVVLAQTLQTMGKGSSPYARHIKSVATKDRMRSIRSCATSLHVETLDSARKMKDQLEASGVVTRIVDDIFSTNETGLNGTAGGEGGRPKPLHGDSELDGKIGEAVRLALGGGQKAADWAEEWATNVRDSWVESIEGVLKVKL